MADARKQTYILGRTLTAGVAAVALTCAYAPVPAFAKVGVAAAVNVDAKGRPPGGAARVISLGQTVIFNEEIITDGAGLVQILPEMEVPSFDTYFAYPEAMKNQAKLKAFRDFLFSKARSWAY